MHELITPGYHKQLRKLHNDIVWGASGHSHAKEILEYFHSIEAKTLLDYGCGRATLKPALLARDPSLEDCIFEYDPAIPDKDAAPLPADLLVANDVLEHIEPELLDKTLKHLRELAIRGAYFNIALISSKVSLPDGRNAHLIIRPHNWWVYKLRQAQFSVRWELRRKGLWVFAR